jgi:hypothetical protein
VLPHETLRVGVWRSRPGIEVPVGELIETDAALRHRFDAGKGRVTKAEKQ